MTILAVLFCTGGLAFAQEAAPSEEPAAPKEPLVALLELIEKAREDVETKAVLVDAARTESEKAKLAMELGAAEVQLARLEVDFQSIATGVDVEDFSKMEPEEFDLAKEAQELLRPIFDELKQVTEKPREIEALRSEILQLSKQRDLATQALEQLTKVIEATEQPQLLGELERTRALWQEYARNADNTLSVRQSQLEKGLAEKGSILDTATDGFTTFFRSRGKNLLATIFTFVVAFLLLRWLGRHLHRFSPWHKPGKRSFYARLVEVIYKIFTVVGAGLVALLVLYASGDWVLIGLTIIFLFGLALAAKGALPKFYEQARLLLNLGEVREGERVMLGGIPWRVESLGVFTNLSNPMLEGGELRLPIRNLTDLRSRPYDDKEPWFPCRCNEWVLLSDGTRGKVIQQTPETVHMVLLGGSRKAYPTTDFIAAAPEVLSRNFRVRSVFGIDYSHQAIATTEVPQAMLKVVSRELAEVVDREHIGRIKVEFREAGSSSLDYEFIADMKGEVADKFEVIARALQKAAVDACNENGWGIPFPQLTCTAPNSSHRRLPKTTIMPAEDARTEIDWANWQPTMRATLVFLRREGEVLLIHKKTGLGKGKVNAPGGKLEPGEAPAQAAVREVKEEIDIDVHAVEEMGTLRFQFVDGGKLALHCVVFVATEFEGTPIESREADPFWCQLDAVPYDQMWEDDRHWLPGMLEGKRFQGDFVFDDERMLWKDLRWEGDAGA